ncbi:MAG: hypothetical protein CVT59_10925 [Actinobacteria bacterium HGW-Actinobacteria-1]|jgi:hypothetical protein|nr:MAG: hypothetical protein CVT59_10925 [Actinobacteria bacterium HGW-Actinobacteria-1]
MNDKRWRLVLSASLLAASTALYVVHFLIFRDSYHIFIYLLGDIAFLPIQVLLVTVILNELLERRSRADLLHKLNMVIGAFFAETGTDLLGLLAAFDSIADTVRDEMIPAPGWTGRQFTDARTAIAAHDFKVDATRGDLVALRDYLVAQRPFLLRLLENQNLLEHQSFTDTLWAVFHLADELAHRDDLASLPASDLAHLSGDIKRAYAALAVQWLAHLQHLKTNYPYLFSLAVRTNPFDPSAHVEVTA